MSRAWNWNAIHSSHWRCEIKENAGNSQRCRQHPRRRKYWVNAAICLIRTSQFSIKEAMLRSATSDNMLSQFVSQMAGSNVTWSTYDVVSIFLCTQMMLLSTSSIIRDFQQFWCFKSQLPHYFPPLPCSSSLTTIPKINSSWLTILTQLAKHCLCHLVSPGLHSITVIPFVLFTSFPLLDRTRRSCGDQVEHLEHNRQFSKLMAALHVNFVFLFTHGNILPCTSRIYPLLSNIF